MAIEQRVEDGAVGEQDRSMARLVEVLRENGIPSPKYYSDEGIISFCSEEEDALKAISIALQLDYPLGNIVRRWNCINKKLVTRNPFWNLYFRIR